MLQRSLSWVGKHKIISAVIAIVVLILGFFVYLKIDLELNKRAFLQASQAIDKIYADIIKELVPQDHKRENECSKSFFGSYVERTHCGVSADFIYAVKDRNEADEIASKIRLIVGRYPKVLRSSPAPKSDIIINLAPGDPNTNSFIEYYKSGSLFCVFKYVFDSPSEIYLNLPDNADGRPFYVTTGCSGEAKQTYYPVSNR